MAGPALADAIARLTGELASNDSAIANGTRGAPDVERVTRARQDMNGMEQGLRL